MGEPDAANREIGISRIERGPFLKQIGKSLIRTLGKSSCSENADSRFKSGEVNLKVNNKTFCVQPLHSRFAADRAPPGREYMGFAVKGEQNSFLNPAQSHIALRIDYVLESALFGCLDENVGVNEIAGEQFCQDDTNGAFA